MKLRLFTSRKLLRRRKNVELNANDFISVCAGRLKEARFVYQYVVEPRAEIELLTFLEPRDWIHQLPRLIYTVLRVSQITNYEKTVKTLGAGKFNA